MEKEQVTERWNLLDKHVEAFKKGKPKPKAHKPFVKSKDWEKVKNYEASFIGQAELKNQTMDGLMDELKAGGKISVMG